MKTISRNVFSASGPMTPPSSNSASSYSSAPANSSLEVSTAACVSELMNAAVSFHKLHLKITGLGSFAGHKALNELYDELPELADTVAEGFQGAAEKLLDYTDVAPRTLNSVSEALSYLRELVSMVTTLQSKMPYSEIINDLDNVKSAINSAKYKLNFLK
jgi:DNA-binding ferritin-like protein